MFSMPGGWEWIVILLVALLIFGKRLPEVARSIGKGLTEFRKGMQDLKSDVESAVYESERTAEKPKSIEPPKTDLPDPATEEPYEADDTDQFVDEYTEDESAEEEAVEEEQPPQDSPPASEQTKEQEKPPDEPPPSPAKVETPQSPDQTAEKSV